MTVIVGVALVIALVVVLTVREWDIRRIGRHRYEAWYKGFESARRIWSKDE